MEKHRSVGLNEAERRRSAASLYDVGSGLQLLTCVTHAHATEPDPHAESVGPVFPQEVLRLQGGEKPGAL